MSSEERKHAMTASSVSSFTVLIQTKDPSDMRIASSITPHLNGRPVSARFHTLVLSLPWTATNLRSDKEFCLSLSTISSNLVDTVVSTCTLSRGDNYTGLANEPRRVSGHTWVVRILLVFRY